MKVTRWHLGSLLVALVGFTGGTIYSNGLGWAESPQVKTEVPKELTSYRDIVKQVLPAVVSIRAVHRGTQVRGQGNFFPETDDDLRRFIDPVPRRRSPAQEQFGSGVLVDPKGFVVTNHHVVNGASEVEVTLQDGRKIISRAIFTDPKTDVAVVKIDAKVTLPWISFGNSEALEIGDRVLAVGAPFGLSGSVTQGIISAKGRSLGLNMYEDFLQTDAAINPGNSGGPLISLDGKVIGINTAIRTENGGFMGVGLAIPSKVVKEVVAQLSTKGSVQRGYLGVKVGALMPEVASRLKVASGQGVVVGEVYPASPAAKAGLQEGDLILRIDSKPIGDPRELQTTVSQAAPGSFLAFLILREGKEQILKVTIEAQPGDYGLETAARRSPSHRQIVPHAVSVENLGLQVMDLTQEMAEQLGFNRAAKGAVIVQVETGSLAESVGLRRGMVIVQADKKPVTSGESLREMVAKASLADGLLLLVRTPQGGSHYVVIQSP